MLKQTQNQKLLQKLSPQQIQYIKLLEVPTALLDAKIKEIMEENPALILDEDDNPNYFIEEQDDCDLEEVENKNHVLNENVANDLQNQNEISLEEYIEQNEQDYRDNNYDYTNGEDERYERPIVQVNSMYEDLMNQLGLLDLDELEYIIGKEIIGELDEDGYLRKEKKQGSHEKKPIPIQLITDRIKAVYEIKDVTDEMVEIVLKKIQTLDPPGIGARDLRECLLIQLQRNPDFHKNKNVANAYYIIRDFFEELSKKHYEKIITKLGITHEELKEAIHVIQHLNHKPGAQFDTKNLAIIPDFILTISDNNEIYVKLDRGNAPNLKLNKNYLDMLEKYQQSNYNEAKETYQFLKNKVDSAKSFIEVIRQRVATLYKIMMTIANKQKDFFLSDGDESKLKPMILEDVAKEINMDISTVSRAVNSKYVETPFGIYELKFFFSSSITKESGDEVSNKEVKKILKEIIDNEDKSKPYSDEKLEKLIRERGYDVARRTIAKYREQMNIPVARLRKEL